MSFFGRFWSEVRASSKNVAIEGVLSMVSLRDRRDLTHELLRTEPQLRVLRRIALDTVVRIGENDIIRVCVVGVAQGPSKQFQSMADRVDEAPWRDYKKKTYHYEMYKVPLTSTGSTSGIRHIGFDSPCAPSDHHQRLLC